MKLTEKQIKKKYPNAVIREGADIREGAYIREDAVIGKGAVIQEGAVIREGAYIGRYRKEVDQSLVILGIGGTKNMTAYRCLDGLIINIGCQNNYKGYPYKEMKAEISKKYDKDHAYFIALKLIKNWYNNL